jgi:hypothetical protein
MSLNICEGFYNLQKGSALFCFSYEQLQYTLNEFDEGPRATAVKCDFIVKSVQIIHTSSHKLDGVLPTVISTNPTQPKL